MRALPLLWLLTAAPAVYAQPAGEPTSGAELPSPNPGPTPQAPVPTTFKRGIVLRYEDIDKRGVVAAPVVVLSPSAGEGPVSYALRDDGADGDPTAGDGRWGAWGEFTPGLDYSVTLHDGSASSPALHTLAARFEMEQSSPTIYFHATRGRFEGGAQAEAGGSPSAPAPPAGGGPAGEPGEAEPVAFTGGNGSGMADAPPEAPSNAPVPPPRPEGTATATANPTLPAAVLYGGGALLAAAGVAGAWFFLLRRPTLVLAGARPEGRPFGVPGLSDGAVTWVLPADAAAGALRDCLAELATYGPIVLAPRPETDLSALRAGAIWRLRAPRPDPADLVRAARGLASAAFVVEGPEALEAALPGESPAAVMDELRARAGRAPVLFVLRDGEPLPANTRVVRFEVEADGALVADGVRIGRARAAE